MTTGSTDAFHTLRHGEWDTLLISGTSYIDSSLWQILDVEGACVTKKVSSLTKDGAKFGLSPDMVTEMWYEGADELCVQCFVIRPHDFDEKKKYPWVFMPHGGPVSSWTDSWSTRVGSLSSASWW